MLSECGWLQALLWQPLPSLVFGVFAALSALLYLCLPETLGHVLPDTIDEAQLFGRPRHPCVDTSACLARLETRRLLLYAPRGRSPTWTSPPTPIPKNAFPNDKTTEARDMADKWTTEKTGGRSVWRYELGGLITRSTPCQKTRHQTFPIGPNFPKC